MVHLFVITENGEHPVTCKVSIQGLKRLLKVFQVIDKIARHHLKIYLGMVEHLNRSRDSLRIDEVPDMGVRNLTNAKAIEIFGPTADEYLALSQNETRSASDGSNSAQRQSHHGQGNIPQELPTSLDTFNPLRRPALRKCAYEPEDSFCQQQRQSDGEGQQTAKHPSSCNPSHPGSKVDPPNSR